MPFASSLPITHFVLELRAILSELHFKHVYVCLPVCVYMCMHGPVSVCIDMCICVYAYTYICLCVCIHVCMYLSVYMCVLACRHVHVV